MAIILEVAPWALVLVATSLFWKVVKPYILKSPLDVIPGPPPESLLKGNILQIHSCDAWPFLDRLTDEYGKVVRLTGFFKKRILWVHDPKALHHILSIDQDTYEDVPFVMKGRMLVFGPGLLSTHGEIHRRQRKLLNPVFSVANMRQTTPLFYETVYRLREGILNQLNNSSSNEVDVLSWMSRTTLEVIGQGALGHSFDPLVKDVPNDYKDALKALAPTLSRLNTFRQLSPFWSPLIKLQERYPFFKRVVQKSFWLLPSPAMHEMKRVIDTMYATSRMIFDQKKKALRANDQELKIKMEEGKDLMSVLLKANMMASEGDRLPEEELIAQVSTLTVAGTDTTSNAIVRILHLLCLHPDVQEKMRSEIVEAQAANGGQDLDYDDLVKLPHMDAVYRETLRFYPPVPFVLRRATRDIVLPLSEPIACTDGSFMTSIPLPKGTTVVIGIYSCNRNKVLWGEDADQWKPERWFDNTVPEAVMEAKIPGIYSNMMTFLGGGRSCIGSKFAQLQTKIVLATLLSSFRLSLTKGANAEIYWNNAVGTYPTVGPNGNKPSLPLAVEALHGRI